jgi:hypothetical protein
MIRGTTGSGFKYEIEDSALDDYELLEVLTEIDNGESGNIPRMVELLLGKEQKDSLKKHCKKDGRVSTKQMMQEITEILTSNGAGKN